MSEDEGGDRQMVPVTSTAASRTRCTGGVPSTSCGMTTAADHASIRPN